MGGPMALHLHRQGVLAAIYSPRTAREFAAKNELPPSVTLAASPRDAASAANTVLVSVPIHQVESVLFGGDGVAAGLTEGLVIESGNSDHRRDPEYEQRFAAKGTRYLDAAVSGGPKRARAGTLVSIVGGPRETFDGALDVFRAFSQKDGIFHVGPTGQGHEAKMYHNQDEQNDMRNIGESISLLMASGMPFRDAFDALNKGDCRSALLTYAGTISDDALPKIRPTIGGGDLPQIAVETAQAIGHPTPLTRLTLDLRRWSRGEIFPDEMAARARSSFTSKGFTHTLRLYNFLRERAWVQDVPGDAEVAPVARALALGYLLDLAEVVAIAQHRQLNTQTLARIFRAGLCDKSALDPLLTQALKNLGEFDPALPPEDRRVFEEGLAFAAGVGHPAPSAAAYLDLGDESHVARELKKLVDPKARAPYGNAIRIQAGIRDAFGEHGYEVAA